MTMKRTGSGWLPADSYGRSLPKFTVNLLVRDVQHSLPFYRDVLLAAVHYADQDFAALELGGHSSCCTPTMRMITIQLTSA
jgi:hypothetical protein